MSELDLCPFCGGKNLVVIEVRGEDYIGEQFEAVCDATNGGCGASGGAASSRTGAIEKWNKRAERTCHVVGSYYDELMDESYTDPSCGHHLRGEERDFDFCSRCGARVLLCYNN